MPKSIRVNYLELKQMLDDNMTQKEIATEFSCNPATISRMIERYKKMGYPISSNPPGRRIGSTNVPKRPFLIELYDLIGEIGGFEFEEERFEDSGS